MIEFLRNVKKYCTTI